MSTELLRELAYAKAVFQLRTIEAIIRGPAQGMVAASAAETVQPGSGSADQPGPKDAPKSIQGDNHDQAQ